MDKKDKEEFVKEFKEMDGAKRLDLWDYAVSQQVLWESIITEMQNIAREQGIDKKLDKMIQEEMQKAQSVSQ